MERRGRGPRGPQELHDVKCSACGKDTQVPFKPIEGRDVFCRECYQAKRQQQTQAA